MWQTQAGGKQTLAGKIWDGRPIGQSWDDRGTGQRSQILVSSGHPWKQQRIEQGNISGFQILYKVWSN